MLSIITCSRNTALLLSFSQNIHDTVGCEYELIVIDNSKNKYSIFSAYNDGIQQSKYPYLCFVHEDVEFSTSNWGEKIISHLNIPNTGLIGVAGGQAMLRVPMGWPSLNSFYNITHSTYNKYGIKIDVKETFPETVEKKSVSVVLLDGVFLCAKKEIFNQIRFDENFVGFHGYDIDISVQSILKGFLNYVVYDIEIKHFSRGSFDINYINILIRIFDKWSKNLPLFEHSFNQKEISKVLYKGEKSCIVRLRKILIRAGMKNNEIYSILKKSILLTGNIIDKFFLFLLPFEINFIRVTSKIRGKMNYQKQKK